jgi:hypothetical protein
MFDLNVFEVILGLLVLTLLGALIRRLLGRGRYHR